MFPQGLEISLTVPVRGFLVKENPYFVAMHRKRGKVNSTFSLISKFTIIIRDFNCKSKIRINIK